LFQSDALAAGRRSVAEPVLKRKFPLLNQGIPLSFFILQNNKNFYYAVYLQRITAQLIGRHSKYFRDFIAVVRKTFRFNMSEMMNPA